MAIKDGVDERLNSLFRQLNNDDEILRLAAATVFINYLSATRRDINDLLLLDADFAKTWRETFDRLKRADRENQFLRRQVSPAVLRKAAMAGEIDYRWHELVTLVETRLVNEGGQLPKSWRRQVADLANVSIATVALWEEGIARIPDDIFDDLRRIRPQVEPQPMKQEREPYDYFKLEWHVTRTLRGGRTTTYVSHRRKELLNRPKKGPKPWYVVKP